MVVSINIIVLALLSIQSFLYASEIEYSGKMTFYKYYMEGFEKHKRTATDFEAYRLLKENPLNIEINHLVMPFEWIFNHHEFSRIPPFINWYGQEAFTVCENDQFERILPQLKSLGVTVVFTPHAKKNKKYPLTVLPFPYFAINGVDPAPVKDIFYSFIGAEWTNPIRKKIIALCHPADCYVKKRDSWHWKTNKPKAEIEAEKKEYQDVLARSRFSLCPAGTGPGSMRFWESLQAAAIPVLFEEEWALPDGFNWDETVIYIKSNQLHQLYNILSAICPEQEEHMRQCCLKAHQKFGGNNLVSVIRDYYEGDK